MQQHENPIPSHGKQPKKINKGLIFILILVTLFLTSFSTTAFILVKANQLTFGGDNLVALQQEVQDLKTELARKNSEIDELKLKVANSNPSASSFTGSTVKTSDNTSKKNSTPAPKVTEKPKATIAPSPEKSAAPEPTPEVTSDPLESLVPVEITVPTTAPISTPVVTLAPVQEETPAVSENDEEITQ